MPVAVKCKVLLYADDCVLLVSGNDVSEIGNTLSSNELESVREWPIGNKLSIHLDETDSILSGNKKKLSRTNKTS